MSIFIRNATLLTMADVPERGRIDASRPWWQPGELLIRDDVIEHVGRVPRELAATAAVTIDARGRVVMPGFVDCHTHACFAGERLDEWDQRRRGVAYLEILQRGGGIMATVRAVRAASRGQLADALLQRLHVMLREGTTTVEVKSGYGLSTADEMKMLGAIADAADRWPGTLVATALLGHALDPEQDGFVERTISETLPAVHAEFPGIAIDAFCEQGAWTRDACVWLFDAAAALGHPIRVHADQFNRLGMVDAAIQLKARSVDHLEASGDAELNAIADSDTFGVGLPVCALHGLGNGDNVNAARLGQILDAGGRVAIASNLNPGSAPSSSMQLVVALATRLNGLEPIEALRAATVAPAQLLGFADRGVLLGGARADVCVMRHSDPRMIAHDLGGNCVDAVICGGQLVAGPL